MIIGLLVVAVLLVVLLGYLAAAETVVNRLSLVRALRLEDEQRPGAGPLLWLAEHRTFALDVLLVTALLARFAFAVVVTLTAVAIGNGWATGGVLVGAGVAMIVVGEVAPRTIALRHLEAVGLRIAGSVRLMLVAVGPLAQVIMAVGRIVVPRRHEVSGPHASDEELRELDGEGEEQDEPLEPEERAMIRSIFDLADTRVREIMTPRPDMVTVSASATAAEVVDLVAERGYSRIPVHRPDDPDVIVGIVYAKDLLSRVSGRHPDPRWEDLVRDVTYVPETKHGDDLLRELQAGAVHLAIVVDEYGAIAGLVTIEDILEEIVGEIVDEHDHEAPLVEVLDDQTLRVDGRVGVDDLNDVLGASLPEEGWDTVGGLVFGTLGRVPAEGEQVELDGITITVELVQGRRVGKVLVSRREHERDTDKTGDARPVYAETHAGEHEDGADGPDYPGPEAAGGTV